MQESKYRNASVEENLRLWKEMKLGSAEVSLVFFRYTRPNLASNMDSLSVYIGPKVCASSQDRHGIQEWLHARSKLIPSCGVSSSS